MPSIQKVKLVVLDSAGTRVLDDEVEGIASGEDILNTMKSSCGFALWASAVAGTSEQMYTVYSGTERQENVKQDMQVIINRLPVEGQCTFTLEVKKQGDRRSAGPPGPSPEPNPGLKPRAGPNYDGFETPAGPKQLARMRGLLALGAPLGGPAYVDPGGVQVAYRDIILRDQYRWPEVPGGPRLRDVSVDVKIRVYENESLYDKLAQRRPWSNWIRVRSDNPFFTWRKISDSGIEQTVQNTRAVVEAWKQNLFSRAQGGAPPVLSLRHTDANSLSTLHSGRPRRVRDVAAWPPTRGP
jgi:hypothetical protein